MISDGVLNLNEIATSGGYGTIDELKLAINNGSLKLDFSECTKIADADGNTDVTIDLTGSDIDLTYLMINDNGLDIDLKEDDQDDLLIIRNSTMKNPASTLDPSKADSQFITSFNVDGGNSSGSNHLYSDLTVEIANLQTVTKSEDNDGLGENFGEVYSNYNNFVNEITGDLDIQASRITVKGDQSIKQNSTDEDAVDIDGVVDVHINITNNYGGSNIGFVTDLLYDINLVNEVDAGLEELSLLVAGLDLHINNTGNFNILAGSQLKVNTNSVLGDTKQESWLKTLENYQKDNPGVLFSVDGADISINDLKNMADLESKISSGALKAYTKVAASSSTKVTNSSNSNGYIIGNATGSWHAGFNVSSTGKTVAEYNSGTAVWNNNNIGNTGTYNVSIPKDIFEQFEAKYGNSFKNVGEWTYGATKKYVLSNGHCLADYISGGSGGSTTTTTTTSTTAGDRIYDINLLTDNAYGLKIGDNIFTGKTSTSSSTRTTGGSSACRSCDPVAMIHIENLGGTGSLYAETSNTAELLSLGDTDMSDGSLEINDFAAQHGIQFQTGIKIEKDADKRSVAGQVQLDISESGKQDRTRANITGQFVNESGVELSDSDTHNNTGTLGKLNYSENFGTQVSDEVMEELMSYFQPKGQYDIKDVASWLGNSSVVSCILSNNIELSGSVIGDIAETMINDPSAIINSGINPVDFASMIKHSFLSFDPLITQALTDNIDGTGGFYDQVAISIFETLLNSSISEDIKNSIRQNVFGSVGPNGVAQLLNGSLNTVEKDALIDALSSDELTQTMAAMYTKYGAEGVVNLLESGITNTDKVIAALVNGLATGVLTSENIAEILIGLHDNAIKSDLINALSGSGTLDDVILEENLGVENIIILLNSDIDEEAKDSIIDELVANVVSGEMSANDAAQVLMGVTDVKLQAEIVNKLDAAGVLTSVVAELNAAQLGELVDSLLNSGYYSEVEKLLTSIISVVPRIVDSGKVLGNALTKLDAAGQTAISDNIMEEIKNSGSYTDFAIEILNQSTYTTGANITTLISGASDAELVAILVGMTESMHPKVFEAIGADKIAKILNGSLDIASKDKLIGSLSQKELVDSMVSMNDQFGSVAMIRLLESGIENTSKIISGVVGGLTSAQISAGDVADVMLGLSNETLKSDLIVALSNAGGLVDVLASPEVGVENIKTLLNSTITEAAKEAIRHSVFEAIGAEGTAQLLKSTLNTDEITALLRVLDAEKNLGDTIESFNSQFGADALSQLIESSDENAGIIINCLVSLLSSNSSINAEDIKNIILASSMGTRVAIISALNVEDGSLKLVLGLLGEAEVINLLNSAEFTNADERADVMNQLALISPEFAANVLVKINDKDTFIGLLQAQGRLNDVLAVFDNTNSGADVLSISDLDTLITMINATSKNLIYEHAFESLNNADETAELLLGLQSAAEQSKFIIALTDGTIGSTDEIISVLGSRLIGVENITKLLNSSLTEEAKNNMRDNVFAAIGAEKVAQLLNGNLNVAEKTGVINALSNAELMDTIESLDRQYGAEGVSNLIESGITNSAKVITNLSSLLSAGRINAAEVKDIILASEMGTRVAIISALKVEDGSLKNVLAELKEVEVTALLNSAEFTDVNEREAVMQQLALISPEFAANVLVKLSDKDTFISILQAQGQLNSVLGVFDNTNSGADVLSISDLGAMLSSLNDVSKNLIYEHIFESLNNAEETTELLLGMTSTAEQSKFINALADGTIGSANEIIAVLGSQNMGVNNLINLLNSTLTETAKNNIRGNVFAAIGAEGVAQLIHGSLQLGEKDALILKLSPEQRIDSMASFNNQFGTGAVVSLLQSGITTTDQVIDALVGGLAANKISANDMADVLMGLSKVSLRADMINSL